ncbi:MAG: hypothetical protein KJ630_24670 [Proteobacteria bacterium]|nr:hypothetical protein [Pseudomonadota bacterium]
MKYLALLKSEKCLPDELPKLTKGVNEAFVSFGSDQSRHVLKNEVPSIDARKPELPPLAGSSEPCRNCERLEAVSILGVDVPGCLYEIPGAEYPDGWKRLPNNIKECIWN